MNKPFEGNVAWVVGASGSIGAAIAQVLAAKGATVVLSGRSPAKLAPVAKLITDQGGTVDVRPLDVCDNAQVQAAFDAIVARYGRLDKLVNSTAAGIFGDFLTLTDDEWRKVLDAKLLGYIRTMRLVIPQMRSQGGGDIVNISGRGGKQPTPAHLPGGCANAAVNLLTKGVADANVKFSIRANVVAPGPIVSERIEQIRSSTSLISDDPKVRAALDREGQPMDVANVVAWLLSTEARHITGAVVPVDGGGTATV